MSQKKMNTFWKKYKIKIIILAYIVAVFLFIRFAIIPFVNKIKEKSDSIQEKILNNKIDEGRIGKIPDMGETLKNCQDKSDTLDVILDPEKEVDFIKQLESIADATGNKISMSVGNYNADQIDRSEDSSKNEEKVIKDNLKYRSYVPMDISLKGSYSSLVNFIHKLENTNYYVNVISIESGKTIEEISSESDMPPGDVFSNPAFSQDTDPGIQTVKSEKEILDSAIKIIIYTEK